MNIEVCDQPIFVLGPPRSGTSMMQWALRQHPNLWGGQESDYLIPLVDALHQVWEFGNQRGRLHWLSGQKVSFDEFLVHVGVGINSLYMSRSGGRRWVEQTPQYTLHLDDMCRLFPDARFLFMVRDGRQVVHSLRNFVNPVEHERACRIWKEFMEAGLAFSRSDRGDQLLFVSYQRAVEDTEAELRKVFDFLDEPFEPASVDFIRQKRPINSSFADETPTEKLQARWTSWSPHELKLFREIAGDLLIALGFETDHRWADGALTEVTHASSDNGEQE